MHSADTGGAYGRVIVPTYPEVARDARRQGLVVLRTQYDASGAVTDVALAADAPKVDHHLARAAFAAVRNWTFDPEVVGGHPRAGEVPVPVCFTLPLRNAPSGICEWKHPGSDIALAGSEAVAVNPEATLLTDVIGRSL